MCLDDDDAGEDIDRFPLSEEHRLYIAFLVRGLLKDISPASIRDAAILLLALERLPDPTVGVDMSCSFKWFLGSENQRDLRAGDKLQLMTAVETLRIFFCGEGTALVIEDAWADVSIDEETLRLGVGVNVSGPAGHDAASRILFEVEAGGPAGSEKAFDQWYTIATALALVRLMSFDASSDHDDLDWDT